MLDHNIVEPFMGLQSNGRLLALPTFIRLKWKLMEVAKTLAYYDTVTITAVKSLYYKNYYSRNLCSFVIS